MSDGAHLLIVDDDSRLRELLRKFLSDRGFLVTVASDSADAESKLASISFDLLVLDVMMPGESGVDLTRRLRRTSTVPILLLTARGEAQDRIAGLASGADDYLPKPFEPDELLLRIRAILRRAPPPVDKPAEIRFGPFLFDVAKERLVQVDTGEAGNSGERVVRLTAAEASLLKVLAEKSGAAVSREELLRESRITGSERTVDVQVTRLRRKIEDDPRLPRYLQTVRGEGYVLRAD
jgi:two-component system phosphate regulon response regulator OmpR